MQEERTSNKVFCVTKGGYYCNGRGGAACWRKAGCQTHKLLPTQTPSASILQLARGCQALCIMAMTPHQKLASKTLQPSVYGKKTLTPIRGEHRVVKGANIWTHTGLKCWYHSHSRMAFLVSLLGPDTVLVDARAAVVRITRGRQHRSSVQTLSEHIRKKTWVLLQSNRMYFQGATPSSGLMASLDTSCAKYHDSHLSRVVPSNVFSKLSIFLSPWPLSVAIRRVRSHPGVKQRCASSLPLFSFFHRSEAVFRFVLKYL